MNLPLLRLAILVIALSAPFAAYAVPVYRVLDLGALGGSYSYGTAINDSGQVTGYSSLAGSSASHAFISNGAIMTDLGTLGGKYS